MYFKYEYYIEEYGLNICSCSDEDICNIFVMFS